MSFRRRLQIGNCRAFFEEAVSDRFPSSINDIRRLFLFYSRGKCRQPVARGTDSGIRESQPLGRGMRCRQIASASGERDFFTNEMDWRPARYVFLYDPGSHIGRTAIRNYYLVGPARLTKQAIEEGAYGLFLIADWNNDANSHLLGPRVVFFRRPDFFPGRESIEFELCALVSLLFQLRLFALVYDTSL